jgi:hypothetical protein
LVLPVRLVITFSVPGLAAAKIKPSAINMRRMFYIYQRCAQCSSQSERSELGWW